jgi:hypothetical protein
LNEAACLDELSLSFPQTPDVWTPHGPRYSVTINHPQQVNIAADGAQQVNVSHDPPRLHQILISPKLLLQSEIEKGFCEAQRKVNGQPPISARLTSFRALG